MVDKILAEREDYRFEDDLHSVDLDLDRILHREEARQVDTLIMIPSESIAPRAVRLLLGSVFTNLYAEGYPALRTSREEVAALSDIAQQLALHRRYADRRFYKGTEFVDLVEVLAQRRAARLFATARVPENQIYANVQALSGAAANNAVYEALLKPGDTMLGLALTHGGHLTHGSPYNRSGRYYNVVPYTVDSRTGRLDYAAIRSLAAQHQPRLIVAGASAYPWDIDWQALREIADAGPGTLLMADIAHPAGLVVAGLFPNPVGYADVVTFTTHKTLCGPRGAVILSFDEGIARRIDRAVFPGEQGGPHVNNIAAMAVAFHIAGSPRFRALQCQIVANARALADRLAQLGLSLLYGGTNTHMLLVDLRALPNPSGYPLKGDVASRILDVAGIVCNKNTIPGDVSAAHASGLRFGTVWASQRGLREPDMVRVGDLIHRAVSAIVPYRYLGPDGALARGKLPLAALQDVRRGVADLLGSLGDHATRHGPAVAPSGEALVIGGSRATCFLQGACAQSIIGMTTDEARRVQFLDPGAQTIAEVVVARLAGDDQKREQYALAGVPGQLSVLADWLAALSDGYVLFEPGDIYAKIEGPVKISSSSCSPALFETTGDLVAPALAKPYFVGQSALIAKTPLHRSAKPKYHPKSYSGFARASALYEEHVRLTGGRNMVPFAGWTMPVWYTSIREEHQAVRQAAGLFDVSHMGVLEVVGCGAARFLDLVTTNYVPQLAPGQSHYSYLLDPNGRVLDDVFLYCRALDKYMLVVNAANAEKIEDWLRAVRDRNCCIDRQRPWVTVDADAEIRNLKVSGIGDEGRVDLALQGPAALQVLVSAISDPLLARSVTALRKTEFVEGRIDDAPAIISRTGYTGEEVGFEIYVPPDQAPRIWRLLLEKGAPAGLRPVGLGARDSARTEAGFPLYGHELAGPFEISPAAAGYGHFVKLHKPFFVGKKAFVEGEEARKIEVVRFRLLNKGARVLRSGDPIVDRRGEFLGRVTSSVVVDGAQVGLAIVARDRASEGSTILAFPLSRLKDGVEKQKRDLVEGDTTLLPEEGTILPRFGLLRATS